MKEEEMEVENILREIDSLTEKKNITKEVSENIKKWLTEPEYQVFRDDLIEQIGRGDWEELKDAFFKHISFGTGGMRGKMGVGPNRINLRTIGQVVQGLANYIKNSNQPEWLKRGVVIGYDTRHNSQIFAKYSATILAANGITTYLYESFRSTPQLSFTVRHLKAIAGIMISASHNPPSDNGIKVYWEDGGQIVTPHDDAITNEFERITVIHSIDFEEAIYNKVIKVIGTEIDEKYFKALETVSLTNYREVKIVYSPLNGTGMTCVYPILKRLGYNDIYLVNSQTEPDANFTNIPTNKPNPEDPIVLSPAIEMAYGLDADIVLASDPDADRLAVAVHPRHLAPLFADKNCPFIPLSGNQVGAMITYYLLDELKKQGRLKPNFVVVKTWVTTELISAICRDFGVECVGDLLVGFKYIADVIKNLPSDKKFLFGTEESIGFLKDDFVRDKDSAIAAIIVCELAAKLKAEGKTLIDYLHHLYRRYGYYSDISDSVYLTGYSGFMRMDEIMEKLRNVPPKEIGNVRIKSIIDRLKGEVLDPVDKKVIKNIKGHKGNMISFLFSDDGVNKISVRPSGTEPKIKFYCSFFSPIESELSTLQLMEFIKENDQKTLKMLNSLKEYLQLN